MFKINALRLEKGAGSLCVGFLSQIFLKQAKNQVETFWKGLWSSECRIRMWGTSLSMQQRYKIFPLDF